MQEARAAQALDVREKLGSDPNYSLAGALFAA